MNIFSDPAKDTKTSKPKPGSYEWWYFDAVDENSGLSLVVIFFDGNPFSTRYIDQLKKLKKLKKLEKLEKLKIAESTNHLSTQGGANVHASGFPAISIAVYEHGKTLFYSFEEVSPDRASFSDSICAGNVGENQFRASVHNGKWTYELELNQTLASGEQFRGWFRFDANHSQIEGGKWEDGDPPSEDGSSFLHAWNLVMPAGRMTGEMSLKGPKPFSRTMDGNGYHDHNLGLEPMKDSFQEWYWGRFHEGDRTFLFYLMHENGEWSHRAWWIRGDGTAEPYVGSIRLQDPQRNGFNLCSARKIEGSGEHGRFTIQLDQVLDNGPYYQRFRGRLIATRPVSKASSGSSGTSAYNHQDWTDTKNLQNERNVEGEELISSIGICEYIQPGRIYARSFWPLVKMRIRYPGKPHWVQKSPRLYRWTW